MLKARLQKLRTLYRLGVLNVLCVLAYRVALRAGVFARIQPIAASVRGPFYSPAHICADESLNVLNVRAFGWIDYAKNYPPNWHRSLLMGAQAPSAAIHWSRIPDFDSGVGDIKGVWELSRFDWLLDFTIAYRKTGNESHISILNDWIGNWSEANPANQGTNWKCGQEASIRVIHLCLAAFLLRQHESLAPALVLMLEQHLHRIAPTVLYAMAQDNNHGTSEAVALFIGGLVLERNGCSNARKWKNQGRFWIENRVKKLIAPDGSFSQYSVNYHRLMLDSLSMAEYFRKLFEQQEFSAPTKQRLSAATVWLCTFVDPKSGDVPNLGANDGARIIPLTATSYRDFRPSARLAAALFLGQSVFEDHEDSHQLFRLLNLETPQQKFKYPDSFLFPDGGYVFGSNHQARCFVKYPRYRFRPSQCDALHVDLWVDGMNLLRDAGTYSYNAEPLWMDYFPGTSAHNTVQFDGREQMPRLSRFLYGDWLKPLNCSINKSSTSDMDSVVAYKNHLGHFHQRSVSLTEESLCISDSVDGFKENAVIRWRLIPGQYALKGNTVSGEFFKLSVEGMSEIKRIEIVNGWESRYYFQKTQLPVLEVEISKPSVVTTKIIWGQE